MCYLHSEVRRLHPTLVPLAVLPSLGCGIEPAPEFATSPLPLEAACRASVEGRGEVPIESDYLPRVVACENGAAPPAALRAQAISARAYLYYQLGAKGSIRDGTSDQVYTCDRPPGPEHHAAVAATRGIILGYRETVVAGFYVAGAVPSTTDCRPAGGDSDRFDTERFVTYNEGLRGDEVFQTPLGFVHPENHANRGAASQNGASCLARRGFEHERILRFYHGEDIELVGLQGCETGEDPGLGDPTGDGAGTGCQAASGGGLEASWLALGWLSWLGLRRRLTVAGRR